jgi:hypothetical protein
MERQGIHRAAAFNWNSTAQKTLDVYYHVAGAKCSALAADRRKVAPARG